MDKDKWARYYRRLKRQKNETYAAVKVADGFIRELKSRVERYRPRSDEQLGPIVQEVEDLWVSVAGEVEGLREDGFARLVRRLEEGAPKFSKHLQHKPA